GTVALACEISGERLVEDGFVGDRAEQRHRRAEFGVIGRAEDRVDGSSPDGKHERGAFNESRTEYGVGEVGSGFRARADCVPLRHGAEAEAGDLREDEPHPVSLFPAPGQLPLDVAKNRVLGPDEALWGTHTV